jgi:tetratricopeptide (TPR) repeat protein
MQLRKQIKGIQSNNFDLLEAGPMQIARIPESIEINSAVDQDISDLRDKLNCIHDSAIDEINEYGIYLEMRDSHTDADEAQTQLDRDIDRAIMDEDIMAFRNKLNDISKQIVTIKAKPALRKYITYVTSAAAVVILLIAGTLILNLNSKSVDNQAYAGLFQPYEAVSVTRGPAEDEDKIRNTAIDLYNQGDFLQAGNLLDAIIEKGETSKLIRVYAGACALQNGDPDKGIEYLANWDATEPTFIDAQWFLAGCYLNKNEWEKALGILEKLVSDEYFKNYPYPAEKLVRKLHRQH